MKKKSSFHVTVEQLSRDLTAELYTLKYILVFSFESATAETDPTRMEGLRHYVTVNGSSTVKSREVRKRQPENPTI